MAEIDEKREELCLKRICRFCMTQEEPLSNIFEKDSPGENAVPLPLQIMACVSVEVFYNDGMPRTICTPCRVLMDRSYRFKQICKQSDSALRQYPNTGVWPEPIRLPDDIIETINVPSRKRFHDEPDDADEISDQGPSSPKQAKKFVEHKAVKNKIKNEIRILNKVEKSEPKILNLQASIQQSDISKFIKIERKSTLNDGNTEQYVLKEDFYGDFESPKPVVSDDNPNKPTVCVETDVFPCEHCDRSFPLQQLLDIHMRRHTRERKYHCEQCTKSFFSKYDLAKHANVHSGEKPFTCVECGKAFARATLLHRHEKVHVDTPKFLCSTCDKTFLSLIELDRHESNHRKTRMFECKECKKTFAYKQGLERHSFVHAEAKPHQCHYCHESFTTDGKLARHIRRHAGSRPYPCRYCAKSFLLSHHLTRHMKASHANMDSKQNANQQSTRVTRGGPVKAATNTPVKRGVGRPRLVQKIEPQVEEYKCQECDMRFEANDDLIYHSAVHATQSLTCPLCHEKFDDLDTCTEHIKSHTEGEQHPCEFCDLIFNSEEKMLEHSENAHQGEEDEEEEEEDEESMKEQLLYNDVKDFEVEEVDEVATLDQDTFEDPLGVLNSITNSNKAKNQNTKTRNVEQPVRRSMRSGRKDYAKMVKLDGDEEDEEEEDNVDDGEIQDDDSESETTLEKLKKKTEVATKVTTTKNEAPKILNSTLKTPTTIKTPTTNSKTEEKTIKQQQTGKSANLPPRLLNPQIAAKTPTENKTIDLPQVSENDKKNTTLTLKGNEVKENVTLSSTPAKLTKTQLANVPRQRTEIVKMKIGDKMVKVQKIIMTKSEVEAMARQGKIEMKGGAMVLKQSTKIAKTNTTPTAANKSGESSVTTTPAAAKETVTAEQTDK